MIDIVRVRDGLMVEHWNVVDAMALLTQIGAIPGVTDRGLRIVQG